MFCASVRIALGAVVGSVNGDWVRVTVSKRNQWEAQTLGHESCRCDSPVGRGTSCYECGGTPAVVVACRNVRPGTSPRWRLISPRQTVKEVPDLAPSMRAPLRLAHPDLNRIHNRIQNRNGILPARCRSWGDLATMTAIPKAVRGDLPPTGSRAS